MQDYSCTNNYQNEKSDRQSSCHDPGEIMALKLQHKDTIRTYQLTQAAWSKKETSSGYIRSIDKPHEGSLTGLLEVVLLCPSMMRN